MSSGLAPTAAENRTANGPDDVEHGVGPGVDAVSRPGAADEVGR
ncbi:hypothetical protein [Kineococcus sp. SYSU DK001]